MISYIDEFEELIARMDSGQGYIQNFVDGLSDLRITYIILVRWNEGSIRTISEAFDLAMEKETFACVSNVRFTLIISIETY